MSFVTERFQHLTRFVDQPRGPSAALLDSQHGRIRQLPMMGVFLRPFAELFRVAGDVQ